MSNNRKISAYFVIDPHFYVALPLRSLPFEENSRPRLRAADITIYWWTLLFNPNDAKWFSCLCGGERQCVEEGFSDKGRLLMVGNSVALPSGREGGGHILIDNWLEFYETPHSEKHMFPPMTTCGIYLSFEIS